LDPTARGKYFAKFFVEIRLKSKLLFEHLICFVVFLLQKLWQKKKQIWVKTTQNYFLPKFWLFSLTFKPEIQDSQLKAQKTQILA